MHPKVKYNITSAKYLQAFPPANSAVTAVINGVEMNVPINENNRHYAAILEWVEEGNTIADPD
jgi:hypothetical protein